MNIDDRLTEHLAKLARLELTPAEKANLRLAEILSYVEKLKSLDTTNVQPLVHTMEQQNVFRPDEVKPGLTRAETMQNASDKTAGFFKVPRVIE